MPGYRVHVIAASPAGLTPYAWNTLKAFRMLYFKATGAELVFLFGGGERRKIVTFGGGHQSTSIINLHSHACTGLVFSRAELGTAEGGP